MDAQGERERKAALAPLLKIMKESPAYQAVMDRVVGRLSSDKLWWKGWVLADEEKAAVIRKLARGYLAFDELIDQMISEGNVAKQILEGKNDAVNPSPGEQAGQGE